MAQSHRSTRGRLFEAASEGTSVDTVKEQLAQFGRCPQGQWEFQLYFFSPNFSTTEKKEGVRRAVVDADPTSETSSTR